MTLITALAQCYQTTVPNTDNMRSYIPVLNDPHGWHSDPLVSSGRWPVRGVVSCPSTGH